MLLLLRFDDGGVGFRPDQLRMRKPQLANAEVEGGA